MSVTAGQTPDGDGVDLRPFLTGEQTGHPHAALFWRQHKAAGTVDFAARIGDLKLVRVADGPDQLYDLAIDPGESTDLAAARPRDVLRIRQELDRWNAQLVAPAFRALGQKLELQP